MGWSELRPKLVKTALAMANLPGGGYIIIGVKKEIADRANDGTDSRAAGTS